jgi:hypothetical protein
MNFDSKAIIDVLKETAVHLEWEGDSIEILLIGGVAAMLTGLLPPERVTQDCDLMSCCPKEAQGELLKAAAQVAIKKGLPENWLNSQAAQLNILPDGWQSRRVNIGQFGKLLIYAASRQDLLAMKFYANRPQDREDIINMKPTHREMAYVRKYLNMLRVPSRQANLDQVASAFKLVDAMEDLFNEP